MRIGTSQQPGRGRAAGAREGAGGAALQGAAMPLVAALALAATGLYVVDAAIAGPLARQMARHIGLMGGVAPLLALGCYRAFRPDGFAAVPVLLGAVALHAGALFFWHLPSSHAFAMTRETLGVAVMQSTLLVAATVFWLAIAAGARLRRWLAVAALIVTGKLVCLIGVLLVFARRPLYAMAEGTAAMADQQLAGLLMLGACPLAYLAAAFVITWRGIPFTDQPVAGACERTPR